MEKNYDNVLERYMKICTNAGKRSFVETIEYGGLKSPLEVGCLDTIIEKIYKWSVGQEVK